MGTRSQQRIDIPVAHVYTVTLDHSHMVTHGYTFALARRNTVAHGYTVALAQSYYQGLSGCEFFHFQGLSDFKLVHFQCLTGPEFPDFPGLSDWNLVLFQGLTGCKFVHFQGLTRREFPDFPGLSGCMFVLFQGVTGCEFVHIQALTGISRAPSKNRISAILENTDVLIKNGDPHHPKTEAKFNFFFPDWFILRVNQEKVITHHLYLQMITSDTFTEDLSIRNTKKCTHPAPA